MGNWKKILSFFFLVTLIFIKLSPLHVFSHQSENDSHIEKCLICTMAIDLQQTVHVQPDVVVFEPEIDLVWLELTFGIDNQTIISNQTVYSYFSRPPPFLLS
ncbi:hypothetical protein [Maribacter polysaccharolyticus]|uniref:hypothetical protein n=1 Tax=Maribacter polysaccharolyticus TaxID=3020831 RepID=UPI00237F47FC|nr:hypothetical protein [Maribacter polysaccharolyticus]MDE3740350.1 hypothetical protein [Maribacter polysaccharolyticus]